MPPHTGWAFEEIARRPGDFAIAGVAATLTLGADGRCSDARLAFCGAGPTPVRAMSAEALLRGRRPDSAAIAAAGDAAAGEIDVADDALVSAGYRRHLAQVLAARALALALARVAQLDVVGAA
jgi:carbon-monoxide dehydrogenase medium subunit